MRCAPAPPGATAYVADYGDWLNKLVGTERSARRVLHSVVAMFSAFIVLTGWLIAWVVHEYKGMSHIAKGAPVYVQVEQVAWRLASRVSFLIHVPPRSFQVHVWIGLVAILGTVFQVTVGLYKFIVKTRDDRIFAPWHGAVGPVVWTALVVGAPVTLPSASSALTNIHRVTTCDPCSCWSRHLQSVWQQDRLHRHCGSALDHACHHLAGQPSPNVHCAKERRGMAWRIGSE
jgi:hypothetical protein